MTGTPVVLAWAQFAPYHHDRLAALATRLGPKEAVIGVQIADRSDRYCWAPTTAGARYSVVTLFPGCCLEAVSEAAKAGALLRFILRHRPRHVFLCNYDRPHVLLVALVLAVVGRPPFLMADAKADERPRHRVREWAKRQALRPFYGALTAGTRSRCYLESLGLPAQRIREGYDGISIARLRKLAGRPPAPAGGAHADRHFVVVARFVSHKNLETALRAYEGYRVLCAEYGIEPRALTMVGDGALRSNLECQAPDGVHFAGFLQADGVARTLGEALALLLPSRREPWGLVVNEAFALGVPVLASDRVGATDLLVQHDFSGYVLSPDDVRGFAGAMLRLTREPATWARLATGALERADAGDVARFADGAVELLEMSS